VPAERVTGALLLRDQILEPVLPDDLDPRLGEDRHLVHRHVLRGHDDGDAGADLGPERLVALADFVR
jgi:hypothetical protein